MKVIFEIKTIYYVDDGSPSEDRITQVQKKLAEAFGVDDDQVDIIEYNEK